ncbi:MAG: cell wall-active antibiotics response protein [Prolixibacteraceae bacterium]|nr:cell wall-active antibiotics response protein [Prolixibacteraceae bacterium]
MDKKQFGSGRRFFIGFILLLIGLVMILYRAGILDWQIYDFLLSWKMLLVAIGAFVFFSGNRGAGIIVMGIGAFFMIPDIFEDYDQIRRFFWPAIILLVGLTVIFGKRPRKIPHPPHAHNRKTGEGGAYSGSSGDSGTTGFGSSSTNYVGNDYFDEFVIFGGREINMATKNLLGGRSTSIFGGTEIDLRQCEISPQGCTVEVTALFGANGIKVPNDWTVLNKITTIFGGYSDVRIKDPSYSPNPSKTIVLTGVCIFGGTEVKNFNKAH